LVVLGVGALTALWIAAPSSSRENAINLVRGGDKTVFVLFDLSGSTQSMRKTYENEFEKILATLEAGDRIIVDRITDRPLAQSTFPVNEEFVKYGILDKRGNPMFDPLNQKELDAKRKTILKTVNNLFNSSPNSNATAIIDSLQLAERVFNTYTGKQKILVIFSDMVEIYGQNNFTVDNLTDSKIAQIVAAKSSSVQLPNLSGVKIYIVGAGAGEENSGINSQRLFNIENFWLTYFTQTGADFTKDRYGAALLEF